MPNHASRLKARIATSLSYQLKTTQIQSEVSAAIVLLQRIEARLEQAQQSQTAQQALQNQQTHQVQQEFQSQLTQIAQQAQQVLQSLQVQEAQQNLQIQQIRRVQQALEERLGELTQQLAQLRDDQRSQDAMQSLQAQLIQLARTSQLTASNSDLQIQALRDFVMGFKGEMQVEIRRLRLSPEAAVAQGEGVAKYLDLLEEVLTGSAVGDGAQSSVGEQPYDPLRRSLGRDWPTSALTMIGGTRMRNMRHLLEMALQRGIEGDFLETGVWRGGACIYAKAIFDAHGAYKRRVFVADSFRGVPPPNPTDYPQDSGDTHHTYAELAISRALVENNFRRFGLLDERVVFVEGWFSETLAKAPVDKLCVLRLDGDLYESTIVALEALYDKVTTGGYVIIDDYLLVPCAQAVNDFRAKRGIVAPMQPVDNAAVWWEVGT